METCSGKDGVRLFKCNKGSADNNTTYSKEFLGKFTQRAQETLKQTSWITFKEGKPDPYVVTLYNNEKIKVHPSRTGGTILDIFQEPILYEEREKRK